MLFRSEPVNDTVLIDLGVWTDDRSEDLGDRIYSETHPDVEVVDGVFDIVIGDGDRPRGSSIGGSSGAPIAGSRSSWMARS